ncbi:peptide ABC transporter substrate-binding protein [Aggregatibacter kilianii]|uniref:peptide ABC transporter substrate-binding protein n=1 Tax=Aggregatibacter kilianii TaxID=2025884 RepID=UPI000D65854B|nr:peptide ABC transporter substrate-binding protein [Aggregatibacter kilianii]
MRIFHFKSAVLFFSVFLLNACDEDTQKPAEPPSNVTVHVTPQPPQTSRQLLVRGVYSDLFLNPLQASNIEQFAFLRDIFEGLVIYDAQGNVMPAMAESWQTKDNKIWRFTLRQEAKWSNGEPVTAQQFVESWQHLAKSASPFKHYLSYINLANAEKVLKQSRPPDQLGIVAENDRTLRLTLDKPTPYLPQMLAHISLLPQYLKAHDGIVTNGAYQVNGQQGDRIHLEKNPHYWAKEKVSFKNVDYQKIAPQQDVTALDIVWQPQQQNAQMQYFPQLCTYFYAFNFKTPQLAQGSVRKALAMMTSARNLLPENKGMIHLTDNFLPISMQTVESRWEQTPVEQLLSQSQISEKSPLKLTLSYDESELQSQLVQGLIRMWSQSDMIRIIGEGMPKAQLLEHIAKGNFQIARSGWCADYNEPSAFLSLFYSHSPDNKSGYRNNELDRLFEQSLAVIPAPERTALYERIEQILQEENVVLPLYQSTVPIYLNPSLNGYDPANPTEVIYSKDLFRRIQ